MVTQRDPWYRRHWRRHRRKYAGAAAAIVVGAAGLGTGQVATSHPSNPAPDPEAMAQAAPAAGHCGVERWAVKTATDPAAKDVSTAAQTASVAELGALAVPANPDGARVAPVEDTTYRVTATLTGFKMEADSDYHLVLTEGGATMIAEIPSPACDGGSRFGTQIAVARGAFDAAYTVTGTLSHVSRPVVVTGVGFFDRIHGQAGVAPNGIELHPVLEITFAPGASPSP